MLFNSKLYCSPNRLIARSSYLKYCIVFIGVFLNCYSFSQIFISEYLEGSGNDKCLELYNAGLTDMNIDNYSIRIFSNGNTSASSTIDLPNVVLASCDVFVICNTSATSNFTSSDDFSTGSLSFNGDDAVALFDGGTMIDLFGNIGHDPGSEWSDVSPGTANGRFIRNPDYCIGVTTDPTGTGFPSFTSANWTSIADLTTFASFGSHTSNCGSCGFSNTINVGALTGSPFNVDCTTSDNGTLAFTSIGTFNSGNVFLAQLSDASGDFTSPTVVGTTSLSGTDPLGLINLSIPGATPDGANYRLRIISSNPTTNSDTTGLFEIILTGEPCVLEPPHLTSVLINACEGGCFERDNELVFGNTGGYSVEMTASNFDFHYGSNSNANTNVNYTSSLITNPTTTSAINSAAGCSGNFVEGTSATLPPGSSFILASNDLCVGALTWSNMCGQGPIYIVYTSDADWVSNPNPGIFSNSSSPGMRYFHSNITTTGGDVFAIDYSYDRSQNTNSNGEYVTFSSTGGAPTLYADDDCSIEPILLPIELIHFSGKNIAIGNQLNWVTQTEVNSDYFLLEKSTNGFDYDFITEVQAAGNSSFLIDYSYLDRDVITNGLYYYRLTGVDYDGTRENHGIVAIQVKSNKIFFDHQNQIIHLGEGKGVSVYALDGRLIMNAENDSQVPFSKKGVFLILNQSTGETLRIVNH